MNSMGMAKYTMITLFLLKNLLITLTLIFLTIFGFIMKGHWFPTLRKEEGRSSLPMGKLSKGIFMLTEFKVSVNTTLMMET